MLRRTLTILAISMLHAGCSTCSIWDECEPGETRSCDYPGCSTCHVATQVCQDNHQWGHCECISSGGDSYTHEPYDPWYDPFHDPDMGETLFPDIDEPDHDEEEPVDAEPSELLLDVEEADSDDPESEDDDPPDDGGDS